MNVGNSHIVPFLFDFLMTQRRVYLRSKLSKFLPDVLVEPARFYFLAIFAEALTARCNANDPCQESGRARVSGLLLRENRSLLGS